MEFVVQLDSLACSAGCDAVGTAVPEPGTLALVASALATLRLQADARSRRRATSARSAAL